MDESLMRCKSCGCKWSCSYGLEHLQKKCKKCESNNIECYGYEADIRKEEEKGRICSWKL
jgi:hypothetical protein